ncbi:MAG TPA: FG-GAP-like repeat-containing protein [Phycisphaerales bacterium]|nr:FG-GAP-like repeat-containing protein [Phycisphaerales bacterium]
MRCHADRAVPVLVLAAISGAAAAQPADQQPAFEVSDSGHVRVPLRVSPAGGSGPSRADDVPYGTTPDWELALRRQVGGLQIADMNGDGRNDLVVGCFHSDSFPPYDDWHDMIFFNTGGGLEASPSWISSDQTHTGDVQIGDVDLDGHLDYFAVSGGGSYSQPRIYFGSATGPSETAGWFGVPPEAGWATSGLLVDIDKDGDLDVFTTNQGVSPNPYRAMYMWRNQAGVLDTTTSWHSAEESIQNGLASADYDGDGWPDVAVAKWVNFETGIYRNDGSGTLETAPAWTTGDDGTDKGVAFADVDGNGWPDLAVGHDEPSRLYGNDAGSLALVWESDAPFYGQQEVRFADVDGDGDPDYSETNFSDGRTHIYLNRDGTLDVPPSWTYDSSTVANTHAFGDINGDGWLDLAIGYSGDVSIRVFYAVPPACTADFNGDGAVNTLDVLSFLNAWNADDPRADINGDGTINTQDVLAFLNLWNAGC